jgi:protoporphyrinogen oxidase
MRIAIVGAGFTGLAAGYELIKDGHSVTIFEKDSIPGGLAVGYQEKGWNWTLEKHYHHWFTNDHSVLNLAKEINHKVLIKTPETNWYVDGKIYKFVSLKAALSFPLLTPLERIRQLFALALLRFNPLWQPLEKFKTNEVMPFLMGKKAYDMLWKSILSNKFGDYANDISLAWFWARIKKRTQSLAYPEGGFLKFAIALQNSIEKKGGKILYKTSINRIEEKNGKIIIGGSSFDKVIVTLPSFAFIKLASKLPEEYVKKLMKLKGIGATNLVLRLKKPFFKGNTYWLSVADTTSPIMAIVEHTNFMDKNHYNGEHLVYLGNYLDHNNPNFTKTKEQLLRLYDPFLKKINKDYKRNIISYELFKAPFAQPIISTNYSKMIPSFETPIKNVYLANIQQVYPWDRGTNYAIELGQKVAHMIT